MKLIDIFERRKIMTYGDKYIKKAEDDKKNKSFEYRLGQIFALILMLCVATCVIASTYKFILWLL